MLLGVGLRRALRRGLAYLLANARRANPDRDRRTGRLRAGLGLAEIASVISHEVWLERMHRQQHKQRENTQANAGKRPLWNQ